MIQPAEPLEITIEADDGVWEFKSATMTKTPSEEADSHFHQDLSGNSCFIISEVRKTL